MFPLFISEIRRVEIIIGKSWHFTRNLRRTERFFLKMEIGTFTTTVVAQTGLKKKLTL